MLSRPYFGGITEQLPRFMEPVTTNFEQAALDPEVTTFVRAVVVSPPLFSHLHLSLRRLLTHTDQELAWFARAAQSHVVPHTWGWVSIAQQPDDTRQYLRAAQAFDDQERLFGRDVLLAAEVDCIEPAPAKSLDPHLDEWAQPIRNIESLYAFPPLRIFRRGLNDLTSGQAMVGINKNNHHREPARYLVDIDPKYRESGLGIM